MNSLVSVVIPVYNGEAFLAEAIQSVLDQDYDPVEVIVIDDGSSDSTAAVATAFPAVTYHYQENQGPAAARNAGIRRSNGEFLAFLDADDVWLPHKLSAQISFLESNPGLSCVLGRREWIGLVDEANGSWLRHDDVFGDLGGVGPMSMLVTRDAVNRLGGFDPEFRTAEGMELLGRLKRMGDSVGVVEKIVMRSRLHDRNLSRDQKAMTRGLLAGLKKGIDSRRQETGSA